MIGCEMIVAFNDCTATVFLQQGFFDLGFITKSIHKHKYSEIHILSKGSMRYFCGNEYYSLSVGDVLIIPPDMFHKCTFKSNDAENIVFQIEYPIEDILYKKISCEIVKMLANTLYNIGQTNNGAKISASLSLVLTEIFNKENQELSPISERAFIIYEFFANEYAADITVDDLAKKLMLSAKQTERLVLKYTGNTFRKELTKRRIEAAQHMIEYEHLSMGEAAARVGYKSYSGFWKAYNNGK